MEAWNLFRVDGIDDSEGVFKTAAAAATAAAALLSILIFPYPSVYPPFSAKLTSSLILMLINLRLTSPDVAPDCHGFE